MCGYGHDNHGRMWMSTGSRGSTHTKHHPLHMGNTVGYFDEGNNGLFKKCATGILNSLEVYIGYALKSHFVNPPLGGGVPHPIPKAQY